VVHYSKCGAFTKRNPFFKVGRILPSFSHFLGMRILTTVLNFSSVAPFLQVWRILGSVAYFSKVGVF